MCARDDVDKRNMEIVEEIIKRYPPELGLYVKSISNKTSYTKMVYVRYIAKFLDYMKETLKLNYNKSGYNKIKPMHIDTYMDEIKYDENGKEKSAMYRNAQLAAINSFFKFLQINEMIKINPCYTIEKPKDKNEHEIITMSDKDIQIIIDNITNGVGSKRAKSTQKKWASRDIALVMLGITTGLRISAIVGIDMEDICLKEKYITVTEKGDIKKKVFLGDKTIKALLNWIQTRNTLIKNDNKALFICQSGKRISVRTVERRFQMISESTGKRITPHKMRATCATRLYEQTGDIYLVQNQLGHKSIKNTERYARVSEQKKAEAANILNNLF